jgi:hypothetical protein
LGEEEKTITTPVKKLLCINSIWNFEAIQETQIMNTLKKIWYRLHGYNDQDIHMITKLSEIEDMVKNMKYYLGKSQPDIHLPTPREKIEWIKKVLDIFQGEYDILYWNKAKVYTEIEEEWQLKKDEKSKQQSSQ